MNPNRSHGARRALGRAVLLALAFGLVQPALAVESRGVVNVNTAGIEELMRLPGVGETRAKAIVALRKERGGFKRVDELLDVRGIGDVALAKLRPHVALSGKTTLTE